MVLFRRLLGDVLRRHRQRQERTLRDVAAAAKVSLGYLSEVERGRKEASSELLASLCAALGISLADVLREVSDDIAMLERGALAPVGFTGAVLPVRPVATLPSVPTHPGTVKRPAVASATGTAPAAGVMTAPVATLSASSSRWRRPVVAA